MTTARQRLNRLVHYCVILGLNIPSYRVEQAKKAIRKGEMFDSDQPGLAGSVYVLPGRTVFTARHAGCTSKRTQAIMARATVRCA